MSAHGSHVRFPLMNILLVISVNIYVNAESQGAGVMCPHSLLVVFNDTFCRGVKGHVRTTGHRED